MYIFLIKSAVFLKYVILRVSILLSQLNIRLNYQFTHNNLQYQSIKFHTFFFVTVYTARFSTQ